MQAASLYGAIAPGVYVRITTGGGSDIHGRAALLTEKGWRLSGPTTVPGGARVTNTDWVYATVGNIVQVGRAFADRPQGGK